ncbi:MAG: hypothetical protein AB7I96_10005 [Candidatus Dadabacteria bacterium]
MIKISLSQLEEVRSNPHNFSQILQDATTQRYGGRSKFQVWQDGIHLYHKINDENEAIRVLTEKMENKFITISRSKKELNMYLDKFDKYLISHRNNGYYFNASRKKISIPIYKDVSISGIVPIINMASHQGHAIIFFSKKDFDWESQIKFPLIQSYFAEKIFGCNISNIEVGIYCFETDEHHTKSYTKNEIRNALDESRNIGSIVSKTI